MLNHEKLYKRLVFERIPFWDFLNELFSLPRDNETVIELKDQSTSSQLPNSTVAKMCYSCLKILQN